MSIFRYAPLQVALIGFCLLLVLESVFANHDPPENILPVTKGVYRLPFEESTQVRVNGDHITHSPHNRIDMSPIDNSVAHNIVAAGDGVIEYIQDSFDLTCPSTTNNPDPCTGYNGPSSTCCERGSPGCNCRNNYVWLRHPNGEWSKYTHMRVGSVPNSLQVGQFVSSGTVIGVEGDVGFASFSASGTNAIHLHFELGVPDSVDTSLAPSDPAYDPLGISPLTCNVCGFPNITEDDSIVNNANRQNRIPVFCQLGFLEDNDIETAISCDGQCTTDTSQLIGTIPDDNVFYRQVTDTMGNPDSNFVIEAGGGASIRAGDSITLSPGFHAENGSFISASIGACDNPGL